ncbi:MAG TPA: TIM barrel protein [Paenibacillus sp.]|nr:TIM barrel protein [Paenibacillus sp.]
MELKTYKALWGFNGTAPLEALFERIAAAGYDGVEALVPEPAEEARFRSLLEQYKLDYIPMIYSDGDHKTSFRERLLRAAEFGPAKVNSHSAKDWMDFDEQRDFFEFAMKAQQEAGVTVAHETHRNRATYSAWSTARLLREFPEMRITADFSHWVVVSETLLEDQADNVSLAIDRAVHIHGRVGFRHGPQVPDPSAPDYAEERAAHVAWWDEICRRHHARGESVVTFDPEFGPPGYMHTIPHTRQPIADLWNVCLWMNEHYKKHFATLGLA